MAGTAWSRFLWINALKWFGQEKIKALEKRHQKYVEEERNKLRQMSLFEFM